jgi:hypothetical protein
MFMKKIFSLFEPFPSHLHLIANKTKQIWVPKFNMGIKNTEFHALFLALNFETKRAKNGSKNIL